MGRSRGSLAALPSRTDPPRSDRYHLETDGSLNRAAARPDDGGGSPKFLAGGGVVIRDPSMRPIEEHSVRLGYLVSAHEAELAALLWGLKRAAQLRLPMLRVRNDNVHVMHALSRALVEPTYNPPTGLSELVAIAGSFASIQFRWTKSSHVLQRGDGAHSADFLARRACELGKRTR